MPSIAKKGVIPTKDNLDALIKAQQEISDYLGEEKKKADEMVIEARNKLKEAEEYYNFLNKARDAALSYLIVLKKQLENGKDNS